MTAMTAERKRFALHYKEIRLADAAINTTREIESQYCTTLGDKDYKQLRNSLYTLLKEAGQ